MTALQATQLDEALKEFLRTSKIPGRDAHSEFGRRTMGIVSDLIRDYKREHVVKRISEELATERWGLPF